MSAGRERTWKPGSAAVADAILRPGGPSITAEAKLVYLALFSYMGADFSSRPSVATLAEGTSVSERTVQRVLKELEAGGLLAREPRFDAEGRRTATLYRLAPPWDLAQPIPQQSGEGDRVTPPPATETPAHDIQSPAPVGEAPGGRQADTVTPSDSHHPGDSLTPEVTQEKKPNEVTQGTPQSDKPTETPPADGESSKTPKEPKEQTEAQKLASDANYIAKLYDELARKNGLAGITDWKADNGVAQKQLKKTGAPRIPRDEAEQAIRWGFEQRRFKFATMGLGYIRLCWSDWMDVQNRITRPTGNVYRSNSSHQPTGTDPMVLPKGGTR